MIVRAVLSDFKLLENFDYFNDYSDTLYFLQSCEPSARRDKAIAFLKAGNQVWMKAWHAKIKLGNPKYTVNDIT